MKRGSPNVPRPKPRAATASAAGLMAQFRRCGEFARAQEIRTGFRPDQFVALRATAGAPS